jgi:hypothetical protein
MYGRPFVDDGLSAFLHWGAAQDRFPYGQMSFWIETYRQEREKTRERIARDESLWPDREEVR